MPEPSKKRVKCPVCGSMPYPRRDGRYACGCEPDDDDPQGEEYEQRKLEARAMAALDGSKRRRVAESTFADVAAERKGWYD